MDTSKWHTVAIRKECYYKLRGLCDVKYGSSYDDLSQKLLEKGKESYVKEG